MLGCRPMQGTDEIRQVRTGRRKIWLITHTNMQELSYSTSLVSRQIHCPPCAVALPRKPYVHPSRRRG